MADVAAPHTRFERHATAKLRRRRDDRWIATTSLVAAMLVLPLAQNSSHGPEVAAVLAVSATAMLAGQRWAIALVVIAELLLVPTVLPRAFLADADLPARIVGLIALVSIVPGMLSMRRAAAALVLVTGRHRTQQTCRRFQAGLVAIALLASLVPLL